VITLFLRLFIASISAIALAALSYGLLVSDQIERIEREHVSKIASPLYYLLQRELAQNDGRELEAVMQSHQGEFPFIAQQLPLSQLSTEQQQKLRTQQPLVELRSQLFGDDEVTLYYPWSEQQVLTLYLDEEFLDHGSWLLWYMIGVMAVCLALSLWWFSFSLYRQTHHLAKVTQAIGQGNFDVSANEQAPLPLNHMAQSLNTMAAKLKSLIQQQDAMSIAASHELKTPINNLRFALDMTRSIKDMDSMHQHIQEMDQDLDSLEELTHELISFSQLGKARQLQKQTIRPLPLLNSICERLVKLSPRLNIEIECAAQLSLSADEKLLRWALNNLIVNSQKYAKKQILIRAYSTDKSVIFEVHDDGIGIPEAYRESIFLPFARVDDSRSRQSGGHGLGLSIVERIAHNHAGKVNVASSPLGGALFILALPISTSAFTS